jgi:hypothetical protein
MDFLMKIVAAALVDYAHIAIKKAAFNKVAA